MRLVFRSTPRSLVPRWAATHGVPAQSLFLLGLVIAHNSLTRAHALKCNGQTSTLDGTQ